MLQPVSRIVDLLDPALNHISNMSVGEARRRVLEGDPAGVRAIDGSFAMVAAEGVTVRLAGRWIDPMRYFLAKRHEGPALYHRADRIDTLHAALERDGLANQFHPSYTRMIRRLRRRDPVRWLSEPDHLPRFFTPQTNALPATLDEIGRRYVGGWRTRSRSGYAISRRRATRTPARQPRNPLASRSLAASTAARSFWSRITR